jgi:hypothetical protein
MDKETLMHIPVFFHTPQGESGIKSHAHNVITEPQHAPDVTRAFYGQKPLSSVWPHIDEGTKQMFAELQIDPNDAVNGEISAHENALRSHAPDLLQG